MADYISPWVEAVLQALQAYTPALLPSGYDQFVDYGRQFTGVVPNFPSVWVMPTRTLFNPDIQGAEQQQHELLIVAAVTGATPDDVTAAAQVYVRAIHRAIAQADAAGDFAPSKRVFVGSHEYGPIRHGEGALARFPELGLIVEVIET